MIIDRNELKKIAYDELIKETKEKIENMENEMNSLEKSKLKNRIMENALYSLGKKIDEFNNKDLSEKITALENERWKLLEVLQKLEETKQQYT